MAVNSLAGLVPDSPRVVINSQVTSYTLILSDSNKMIEINSASATTVTIPTNSTTPFPIGTKIDILATGTGDVTISGASGVTVNSESNKAKIFAQWSAATVVKRDINTWVLIGALKA